MISHRDVTLKDSSPKELLLDRHETYLKKHTKDDSEPDQIMAEYLKMSGMYWGINALYISNTLDIDSPEVHEALEFIKQCQSEDGGFSAAPSHDSHILHTLSAVQVLVILDKCNTHYIDIDRCVDYIKSLQKEDGCFTGDKWGEVDTRFSFCALATLELLNRLNDINLEKAVEFVLACNNEIDGGFGSKPGSESHSAYVYCCVGSLAIANQLDRIDKEQLGWWLSERQLPSGGLCGRPEKLPDLCYSWWCLASMMMINQMHRIDYKKLVRYILACQDEELGGFSDRPGNIVDLYHTMFGITSLSLICQHHKVLYANEIEKVDSSRSKLQEFDKEFQTLIANIESGLKPVNSILCMPQDRLDELKFETR